MHRYLTGLTTLLRQLKKGLLSPWCWLSLGLSFALFCAMKPPATHLLFADSIVGYSFGLSIAIASLLKLWRQRLAHRDHHQTKLNCVYLTRYCQLLDEAMQSLQQVPPAESAQLSNYCQQLKQLRTHYLLPMSQLGTTFSQQSDLQILFVLTLFARGERLLNRSLSAALEGYTEEANRVLPEAVAAFTEARQCLHTIEKDCATPS